MATKYSSSSRVERAHERLAEDVGVPRLAGPVQFRLPASEGRRGEGGRRRSGSAADGRGEIPRGGGRAGVLVGGDHDDRGEDVSALPLVSVITVVFNGEEYLEQTILSVLAQTYGSVEYIVIDGGSTDGTLEILRQYEHVIDYWLSEPDGGIYDGMNKGIAVASGEYLVFLNCGDLFYAPESLAAALSQAAPGGSDLIYGDSFATKPDGTLIERRRALRFDLDTLKSWGTRTVCHQAVLIRRSKAPLYDARFRLKGELNWYFDILDLNPDLQISRFGEPLVYFRRGGRGSQQFYRNFFERVLLIHRRFGWKQSVSNVPYYLVSLGFRFLERFRS